MKDINKDNIPYTEGYLICLLDTIYVDKRSDIGYYISDIRKEGNICVYFNNLTNNTNIHVEIYEEQTKKWYTIEQIEKILNYKYTYYRFLNFTHIKTKIIELDEM